MLQKSKTVNTNIRGNDSDIAVSAPDSGRFSPEQVFFGLSDAPWAGMGSPKFAPWAAMGRPKFVPWAGMGSLKFVPWAAMGSPKITPRAAMGSTFHRSHKPYRITGIPFRLRTLFRMYAEKI